MSIASRALARRQFRHLENTNAGIIDKKRFVKICQRNSFKTQKILRAVLKRR